jgi:hypothetical protein
VVAFLVEGLVHDDACAGIDACMLLCSLLTAVHVAGQSAHTRQH